MTHRKGFDSSSYGTSINLHSFYNSIVHGAATNRHPTRSARLIDAPSVRFAGDPFADVSLTECSMTLCGQRDSVATQVVPMLSRLPVVRPAGLASMRRPNREAAAQKRTHAGQVVPWRRVGAPRSMKMGTIASPCRYDAVAHHALQSVSRR
jgi:hypothetical protein